jgi:hypothetical protein
MFDFLLQLGFSIIPRRVTKVQEVDPLSPKNFLTHSAKACLQLSLSCPAETAHRRASSSLVNVSTDA